LEFYDDEDIEGAISEMLDDAMVSNDRIQFIIQTQTRRNPEAICP
jgi:hypothetical protein